MPALTTNPSEPNDYGLLLIFQETGGDDGPDVHHFVCSECLDLVESQAGSRSDHDCQARQSRSSRELNTRSQI